MTARKNIFVIIGSASKNSANEKIIDYMVNLTLDFFSMTVFKDLKALPPFDPEQPPLDQFVHSYKRLVTQAMSNLTMTI